MAIKIIDRKIKSYRGFKTLQLKYLDTTTGKTWFSEGDLSKKDKDLKIKGKKKGKGLKIKDSKTA